VNIRWLPEAVDEFEKIVAYLEAGSPPAAERIANELYDGIVSLADTPYWGRVLEDSGSRQIIFAKIHYIVTYTIVHETVVILRIIHTSRRIAIQ
jgi:plasmid stabilization system protein ParE